MVAQRINILLLAFFVCAYTAVTNAQEVTISGFVRDMNTHREIPYVNIYIEGTQIGTSGDFAGRYLLRIPDATGQMVVVFRHIAYEPQEVALESLPEMRYVYLQPRVIPLRVVTIEEERIQRLEIEKDLPQTVSLVEAKNFDIRGYVDAGDLLRMDHSIQVEEELSGKKTVSIRGGNPDEVLVLYNGIKMNSAYDNIFDLSLIDLEDIERFEIIKGSNTALYGPEAFSGVINIVPKVQHEYNIRFQQRLGTYRSGNWGLHLNHTLNPLHGSYSFKRGGGKRNFVDVADDKSLLENTSLHHTANLSYNFSERADGQPANSLSAMYIYSSLNYDNQRDVETLSNLNELLSLRYSGDLFKLKDINLSVSLLRLEEDQILVSSTGAVHRGIEDRTIHVNARKGLKFGPMDLLLAYQFQDTELDFSDERVNFQEQPFGLESAQFKRQHHGLVLISKLRGDTGLDSLHTVELSISLRHDRMQDEQTNPILRSSTQEDEQASTVGLFNGNDWQENMFKFALSLSKYRENLTFKGYLSFGINTKFPTLLQQISSPILLTADASKPNLNPEKNRSSEVSVFMARDIRGKRTIYGWQISVNYFQNYYDNKFRLSVTPGVPVTFYDNVPDARISGIEAKSDVFFFRKKVTVELGISRYFISEKAAFPFKSDFKRTLNFIVDHAGYSFQIHWFKESEQAGWLRQKNGRFAEVTLPDYSNLDLHLSKAFQLGKLKLFANASGRNLLYDNEEVVLQGLAIRDRRFYITVGAQY
ncbi:MAG: TonB-dependent receptor plug domain-containing protein [Candidatus Marinimicrobia bacterium]|nr:TonB-dependent receptor plug domain-containing protein [Candidatus Neomarinimicrobiota bacterium]